LALGLTGRIWVCLQPQDGRKGMVGLAAVVTTHLGRDPLGGDLFVFRNRRGDRLKILAWQDDGFALYLRRLERGTFAYRLEGILARLGWNVSRSTLCDQMMRCAEFLTPLYDLMCRRVRASFALHADDTPMSVGSWADLSIAMEVTLHRDVAAKGQTKNAENHSDEVAVDDVDNHQDAHGRH
jgi:transposase